MLVTIYENLSGYLTDSNNVFHHTSFFYIKFIESIKVFFKYKKILERASGVQCREKRKRYIKFVGQREVGVKLIPRILINVITNYISMM